MAVGWIAATSASIAEEPQASEYQVKASILINLPKYVDWPPEAFARTNSPIVIAVLGETKVTGEIQKVMAGRTVNGREIVLKRLASGEESDVCHILFVPEVEQQRSPNVLARVRESGVLTVGESDDFLEHGGTINLARRAGKIALEVNLLAAEKARIKIGSKLLGVASVVKGKSR
jgi:YfiR/HmsC-like